MWDESRVAFSNELGMVQRNWIYLSSPAWPSVLLVIRWTSFALMAHFTSLNKNTIDDLFNNAISKYTLWCSDSISKVFLFGWHHNFGIFQGDPDKANWPKLLASVEGLLCLSHIQYDKHASAWWTKATYVAVSVEWVYRRYAGPDRTLKKIS